MLGMSAVPSFIFLFILLSIPESPRWLILKHQPERALPILNRIYKNELMARTQIYETQQVLHKEKQNEWAFLMKPGIRKAVIIGAAIAILGQFMGVNAVLYYGPTIFMDSGLSSGDSLFYQVFVGLVNSITTVIALIIIDKVGRKKLVYWGVSGMIVSLLSIGLYFIFGKTLGLTSILLLVLFLLYIFCCAISICAVIFVLLSEMFPIEARGLAMSIAGFSLWFGTFLIGQLTPWLLENLSPAGTFFLFAVACIPYMLIVWKLIPETAGKSLEEIERFWISNG
jgi:MFS family permease